MKIGTRMKRASLGFSVLCCSTLGTGCVALKPSSAQPETRVAYQAKLRPGTPRYEEREDEVSNRPVPFENPLPLYPESAIPLHLASVIVSAKIIVDRDGRVDEVRMISVPGTDAHPVEFDAAVREALARWRFTPLTFSRWEDVNDAQGNVIDSRQISAERRPFSLDYEFYFELRGGKPSVGAQSPSAVRRE
jgi:hypothetical protein